MGHVHHLGPLAASPPVVEGGDVGDVAEEVADQIDHVDRVLDEGAAALFVAARPPANGLAAVEKVDLHVAWSALGQQLDHLLRRRVVAAHEAHLRNDAGGFDLTGELDGLGHVEADGFFDEDSDVPVDGAGDLVGVQRRWQVDVEGVELFALEHFVMVGIGCPGAEGGGLLGEGFLADVTEGAELDIARLDQRGQSGKVGVDADVSEADKADVGYGHGQTASISAISSGLRNCPSDTATDVASSSTVATPDSSMPTCGSDSR